jgi:hypothetical protein
VTDEIEVLRLFRDEMPGPSTDAWARARLAIAAARSEEEPAGRRRSRGPRGRRLLSLGVVVAVAAAVGGLLAVLLPTSPVAMAPGGAGARQARETAYVVSRVRQALSWSAQHNLVGYARTVYPHGAVLRLGASSMSIQAAGASSSRTVGSVAEWWYQGTGKTSAFTAAGQRVLEVANIAGRGEATVVAVNYRDATWWRATIQATPSAAPVPRRCGGPGVDIGAGGWPVFIRYELSCGGYTADGRQRIDGISAIKITQREGLVALWVNPATYLPVRVVTNGLQRIQADFRWLSPTPAYLARLRVPIPPGFRQVRPPS